MVISLNDLTRKSGVQASDSETSHPDPHADNESSTVRVRLPKLKTKRFTGKVEEWQEFWDSFKSAIHTNSKLSPVDKFSYLRRLLVGAVRTSIAGLALKSANYEAAIDILKPRFGRKIAIDRALMTCSKFLPCTMTRTLLAYAGSTIPSKCTIEAFKRWE